MNITPEIVINAIPIAFVILMVVLFFVLVFVMKKFVNPVVEEAITKQELAVRTAGEAAGLTYWKGDRNGKYASSKALSLPGVSVYYGLSSDDGIDLGLAVRKYPDQKDNSQSFHNYMSARLPRDAGMYLLIDSQRNNFLGLSALKLMGLNAGLQQFVLESNFPENYKVYGVKGSQIETLQLLNPKAMVQLIERFTKYDFEISGDSVYMYGNNSVNQLSNPEEIKKFVEDGRAIRQFMIDHLPLQR